MKKLQQPALDPGEGAPEPLRKLVRAATSPDPRTRPDMALMHRVLPSLVERRGGATAQAPTAAAAPARVQAWSPPPDSTMRVPDPVRSGGFTSGGQTTSHSRRRFRERRRSVIVAWAASVVAAALLTALIILMVRGPRGREESPEGAASPSASPINAGAAIKPVRAASPRPPSAVITPSPIPSPRATPTTSTTTTTTPRPSPTPHPSPLATPPPAEAPPPAEPTPTPSPSPPA